MTEISQHPTAVAKVVALPPEEAPPEGYYIVSMLQAIQAGRYFMAEENRIQWHDEAGNQLAWLTDGVTWWHEGGVPDRPVELTVPYDDEYEQLFNSVERIIFSSLKGWVIRWGRSPSQDGSGYVGYIVHSRPSHGNVPRLEISPDLVITTWYHRPEPDIDGDDYARPPTSPDKDVAGSPQ